MSLPLCGSTRVINGATIKCDRKFGHSPTQKHRAVLPDFTTILWDGAVSAALPAWYVHSPAMCANPDGCACPCEQCA